MKYSLTGIACIGTKKFTREEYHRVIFL